MKNHIINVLLVATGFILSPLSWWNDLVINVPLAYIFSVPFSLLNEKLFLPAFIVGYWLTNLIGFILLYWGGEGLVKKRYKKLNLRQSLYISMLYSFIIIVLVYLGWISSPAVYLEKLH